MTHILFSSVWILVYASAIMALLLDVQPSKLTRRNRLIFSIVLPCTFLLNFIAMGTLDLYTFGYLYPLIGQLPVFLVFLFVSNRGFIKTFFVLLTTIFLAFPYSVTSTLFVFIFKPTQIVSIIFSVIISIIVVLFIRRFVAPYFIYMMNNLKNSDVAKFCFIPMFYNVLTYFFGKYADGITVIPLRFFLFFNTFVVYFLIINILKSTKEMEILQGEKNLLAMLMESSRKQMDELRTSQSQTILYRHDIRHHLSLINSLMDEGKIDTIKIYLNKVQTDLDAVTPVRFCKNETVNLILSSFLGKAEKFGVFLYTDVELPDSFSISDTELCTVLSNGLENAIYAASIVKEQDKTVKINLKTENNNLLIFIENTCVGKPILENGIPISTRSGHGFGVKSMVAIAENRNGYFSCETQDGIFTLWIVLPLDKDI